MLVLSIIFANAQNDITIQSNTTWNSNQNIYGNILITNSSTLTISYCTISIAYGKMITINPGSKLIIIGGTLTNATFGKLWQGITVFGSPQNKGEVRVTDNGKIMNAHCAITVNADGVVSTQDAHFINNTLGVSFNCYAGGGSFKCTNFELNDFYFGETEPGFYGDTRDFYMHIEMIDSKAVTVEGCTFSSTASDYSDINYGILVYDSDLTIKEYCPAGCPALSCPGCSNLCQENCMIKTKFKGFNIAIFASNWGSLSKLKVRFSIFDDNYMWGISIDGINYPEIIKNEFYQTHDISIGLDISNSTGYKIEENLFKDRYPAPGKITFGTYIRISGSPENEIYKNVYDGLYVAQLFAGKNSSQGLKGIDPQITGLQTLCNEFKNSQFEDIRLGYLTSSNNNNSIKNNQGSSLSPAGNDFKNKTNINIDNTLSQYNLNYYYDVNQQNSYPTNVSRNVTRISTPASNGCPSKLFTGYNTKNSNKINIDDVLNQYDEWNTEYEYWLKRLMALNGDEEYEMLFDMVSYFSALKDNYFNSIVVAVIGEEDTVQGERNMFNKNEKLRYLFHYRNSYTDNLCIIETYLAENSYKMALATIDNMYTQFELSEEEKLELKGLQIYVIWLQQLYEAEINIDKLTGEEIDFLVKYVESNIGRGVVYANNILCKFYHICIEDKEFPQYVSPKDYIPVEEIIDVPTEAIVGIELKLTAKVVPQNATRRLIFWSVYYPGTTGAVITGGRYLNTTAPGFVTVTATIRDGIDYGIDYTQNFVIKVNPHLGINAPAQDFSNIKLYPNPASGELEIDGINLVINKIEILDSNGKTVSSHLFHNLSEYYKIDISNLSKGIYIVKINTEKGEVIKKVIKK